MGETSQFPQIRAGRPKAKPKDNSAEWIASAITLAIVFGGCGGCYMMIYGNPGERAKYGTIESGDTITDAKFFAREAVKKHLKWPDDAEFLGGESVSQMHGSGAKFRVRGKVKAMNGFGAKLTNQFVADVGIHSTKPLEWRFYRVQVGDEILFGQ